jgi:hypothetical protein
MIDRTSVYGKDGVNLALLSLIKVDSMTAEQMLSFDPEAIHELPEYIVSVIDQIVRDTDFTDGVGVIIRAALSHGVSLAQMPAERTARIGYNIKDLFDEGCVRMKGTSTSDKYLALVSTGISCLEVLSADARNASYTMLFGNMNATRAVGPCIALGYVAAKAAER